MKDLTGIVIPTGDFEQDIKRVRKAFEYNRDNYFGKVPYIISGIGPDINEALTSRKAGQDFHMALWNYMTGVSKRPFGVDINSLNSEDNLVNTFPVGQTGKYAIVSYSLHLLRFRLLGKRLKKKGAMSKDVQIECVPTKSFFKQTPREIIYETLAWGKMLLNPALQSIREFRNNFFKDWEHK